MLSFISDVLSSIANFFVSVWNFIINLIEDIVYVVKLAGEVIGEIPSFFTWMPPSVLALLVALLGIVVVYKVINRD